MSIPAKFSASAFGFGDRRAILRNNERLAAELAALIAPRIISAEDSELELEQVVAELRELGHALVIDEDDTEWRIYTDLPDRDLAIWAHWATVSEPRRASRIEVLWQKM